MSKQTTHRAFSRWRAGALWLLALAPVTADAATEIAKALDHPSVTRFKGSIMIGRSETPHATLRVEPGPLRWQAKLQQLRSPQSTTIEGDVSRYVYIAPNTTSALEIRRNYEQALGSQGFRVLYACAEAACGTPHANIYNDKSAMPRSVWGRINFRPAVFQFLAARSESRHVLVMIGEYVNPGDPHHHHPVIYQIVIEPNAAKTGQVTVDASAMSEAIAASGKALLYGLYFDTDSAVLKSESQPQLKELAAFLRTNAKMSVLIVGHTDSQGKLDYNVRLSERRAAAVVKALVGEHGIAAGRLTARGVGMLAPVASNRNEAGRAKNRRVEIVEHGP